MKRRSSKGNPYHVPAGSPKGGQFTTKNSGIAVVHNENYYAAKTQLRKGEITEEDFQKQIKNTPAPSETPSYDMIVEGLKQNPDISTHEKKAALFTEVVSAFGSDCDVPIRKTQGRQRLGGVKFTLKPTDDGYYKEATAVTLSAKRGDNEQLDTLYHEAYHFCANGGESDCYEKGYRGPVANKKSQAMEETMAVCAGHAMCVDTGVQPAHPTYPDALAENLPKLKHNTERFQNCNTITDVGRIAWDERSCNKNSCWNDLCREANSKPLPKGYYNPYITHIQQNREKIIDKLVIQWDNEGDPSYRKMVTDYFVNGCDKLKDKSSLSSLSRNEKLVVSTALMDAFLDMGIL